MTNERKAYLKGVEKARKRMLYRYRKAPMITLKELKKSLTNYGSVIKVKLEDEKKQNRTCKKQTTTRRKSSYPNPVYS